MTDAAATVPPTLLYVIGPPAVGKMSVGHEIARRTGLRLLHNHLTIDPVLRFFEFGSPEFRRLVDGFRRRLIEEVAGSDLPGLIFTMVQDFDNPDDQRLLELYAEPFRSRGGRVLTLELEASQQVRLVRNEGVFRLAEKPTKRDLAASRSNLLALDAGHRLNSTAEESRDRADYLRIDNTALPETEVAEQVIVCFGLRRTADLM